MTLHSFIVFSFFPSSLLSIRSHSLMDGQFGLICCSHTDRNRVQCVYLFEVKLLKSVRMSKNENYVELATHTDSVLNEWRERAKSKRKKNPNKSIVWHGLCVMSTCLFFILLPISTALPLFYRNFSPFTLSLCLTVWFCVILFLIRFNTIPISKIDLTTADWYDINSNTIYIGKWFNGKMQPSDFQTEA